MMVQKVFGDRTWETQFAKDFERALEFYLT